MEPPRGGLLPDRSGFAITFLIDEGVRYKVDNIDMTSEIENIDLESLKDLMKFGDDNWYDVRLLEQGLLDISNQLGVFGYAFVDVVPLLVPPLIAKVRLSPSISAAERVPARSEEEKEEAVLSLLMLPAVGVFRVGASLAPLILTL